MQIRSSISATHAHRYIHVLGGAMLASSPGSSHFFNVARRKTRERAWYLIARDQPTTVQSMGRVQIARRQCLSPSMQGTASARGERMRRHNVSQVRHCRHANLYPSPYPFQQNWEESGDEASAMCATDEALCRGSLGCACAIVSRGIPSLVPRPLPVLMMHAHAETFFCMHQ